MALMARLSSWFLATLLAQTFGSAHKTVGRRRQAAIMSILGLLLLQVLALLLQAPHRLGRPRERFGQAGHLLTQDRIRLTERFQFFVFAHAATLADLLCSAKLHGPSEYTRNLDCEQIFEYAYRGRQIGMSSQ